MSTLSHLKNGKLNHASAKKRSRRNRSKSTANAASSSKHSTLLATLALLLAAITALAYWPIITELINEWSDNEDYSAGQLVPWVALFLLWREWKHLKSCPLKPAWIAGIILLLLAQAARAYGLLFMFQSAERYALVLTIAALVLLVAGWQIVRRLGWILLFLFLIVPLPGKIHNLISNPLQRFATDGSVFLMEALGVDVSQQGNVMMLNGDIPLAVAEACSGLRMLMAFIIVTAFIAYMVKNPRWHKTVLLLSSIPVAVIGNIVRIFATALLMIYVSEEFAQKFFHDFAGLVMMPIAVMLLFSELWLLEKLVIPDNTS